MYRILWDDGETEYYAIRKDFLMRMDFLNKVCGYTYGRDYYADRLLDGISMDWQNWD